jgi:hypothetical protein
MIAAPHYSSGLKSRYGTRLSADPVLTGGRPLSWGKKRVGAPHERPGEGSKHAGTEAPRSRREGPEDQPWVVHAAKTQPRAARQSGWEATGRAHQAVVANLRRSCCSRAGPVGTPGDGPGRRVQGTRGYTRGRTPWLGGAQTCARRVYADHGRKPVPRAEGAPRSSGGLEPDAGHPTVRDHREALGTVDDGGMRIPLRHRKGGCRSLPSYSAARAVSIPILACE